LALRPLVIDVAEEGQHIALQPMNVGGVSVTTGPELAAIAPLGGTYWVDNTYTGGSNDGSDERPFTTITAGLARIALQAMPIGTLLIAGLPDYTAEGLIAIPDAITARIFAWGTPSQQAVTFSATCGTGAPLVFLRGCNVELELGDGIIQADMTSIVATSNTGGSTLVMRGGSARLNSQVCRLSGTWDDAACSLMHVGVSEAALDCVSLQCDACTVEGASLVAGTCTFRTTSFESALVLTATTINMDRQSERSAALAGVRPSTLPVPLEPTNPIYGTGATGSVTLNAGSVLLSPTDEYDNLTLTGTGAVRLENSILRVRNLLNLSTAGALAIRDYTGGGGVNAAGVTGGGSWGGTGGSTQGNSGTLQAPSGPNGGNGGNIFGNGSQATAAPTLENAFGGKGGASNKGGDMLPQTGGAGRAAATVTNARVTPHWPVTFVGPSSTVTGGSVVTPPLPIMGGMVGQAGPSGAGDNAASQGGGGGGAGRGGGSVLMYARGIELGAGTAAGAISANGQNGGNGGNGAGSDSGGGAAGAGGGGGFVLVAYDWLLGTQPAGDEVQASGGNGGTGGTGPGNGDGGSGGNGGDGGQIVFWNLLTNTRTIVLGAAGTAGTIPVGTSVGGAGGTGGACTADFPS
jgi:hypothetical protein